MEQMRVWVEEAGRDWSTFGVEQRINVSVGSADDWRASAEEWTRLGATHLSLVTAGGELAGLDAHLERLREARAALA
jgi:hypothetical protein